MIVITKTQKVHALLSVLVQDQYRSVLHLRMYIIDIIASGQKLLYLWVYQHFNCTLLHVFLLFFRMSMYFDSYFLHESLLETLIQLSNQDTSQLYECCYSVSEDLYHIFSVIRVQKLHQVVADNSLHYIFVYVIDCLSHYHQMDVLTYSVLQNRI